MIAEDANIVMTIGTEIMTKTKSIRKKRRKKNE